MMKMQSRISFSVDSLLGRKTTETDIKPRILHSVFTELEDKQEDRRAEEDRRRDEEDRLRAEDEMRRRMEDKDESKDDIKEETESEDDLCVDDEDEDENQTSSPSPPIHPHPIMPTPLLGRGMPGLANLLRPGWPGHLPFTNQSLFDKGDFFPPFFYYSYFPSLINPQIFSLEY